MIQDATVWHPYTQMLTESLPIEVISTKGSKLNLADGRTLIDGIASWWTACHGYNHPHILREIHSQLEIMPHVMMGGITHPQVKRLCQRLIALLPSQLGHVFLSDSGSASVETAIKIALQYWQNQNNTQRRQILHFKNSYHGDTLYAMSLSCEEGMHHALLHQLPQHHCLEIPESASALAEFDQFLATHAQHIAAMIIEPLVQGAGGMKMHSAETLSAITQRCQQHGIVVIYDEIFTGFGRTGSLFAFEQTTVVPDIICLSKALTGGTLPLSATIASTTIFEAFLSESLDKALRHGFTFMGNALACSAANAGLDLFEQEPRLAQVRDIESILNQTLMPLKAIAGVKDVRVKGAIGAVQLEQLSIAELNWFKARSIADGVWLRPLMDVIYTTPPFTIETPDLLEITRSMQSQVKDWSEQFRIVSKA